MYKSQFEDAARFAVKAAWLSKRNWDQKEWAKKMYEALKPCRDGIKPRPRRSLYFRGAAIGAEPGNRPKRKQTKTVKEPSTMKKKEIYREALQGLCPVLLFVAPLALQRKTQKKKKTSRATKKDKEE